MPNKIITVDRPLRAIQAKLEKLELEHLREYILQQQTRIEALEDAVVRADDNAEFWRQSWFQTAEELANETGAAIAMTKDGQIGMVDRREALIRKISGLNPEAGEIGAGMLAYLVSEAKSLIDESREAESNGGMYP